jgi:hypothetical protein
VAGAVNEIIDPERQFEEERCVVTKALEKGFSSCEPIRFANRTDAAINIEVFRDATLV